jgi:quinol monooxygenase YgiN
MVAARRSITIGLSLDVCLKEECMVTVALLARLEAKPGKEEEVAELLKSALPLANAEPATTVWFALKLGPSTFGIFDAFPDDAGRQAHLAGQIAAALMAKAPELLAQPPTIEPVDVLAAKLTR